MRHLVSARGPATRYVAGAAGLLLGTAGLFNAGVDAAAAATSVAAWHMDEASGTTMLDSAGRDNDGDLHSVTVGASGRIGNGYAFNGKSSYVSVPSKDSLNPKSANVTISISFKTTSLPSGADWDLIRKGYYATSGGEWKVELQPSGRASCGFKGSGYVFLEAGPNHLNDGAWHTVTCTKTSSAVTLKVDGKSFSKSGKVGSISNTKPIVIGAYPGKEFFKGTLDEASVTIG